MRDPRISANIYDTNEIPVAYLPIKDPAPTSTDIYSTLQG